MHTTTKPSNASRRAERPEQRTRLGRAVAALGTGLRRSGWRPSRLAARAARRPRAGRVLALCVLGAGSLVTMGRGAALAAAFGRDVAPLLDTPSTRRAPVPASPARRRDGALSTPATAETGTATTGDPLVYRPLPSQIHNHDVSLCLAECGDLVVTHTIPAYTSLDVDRALTLVYNSGQAFPVGTIQMDVRDTNTAPAANVVSLKIFGSSTPVADVRSLTEIFFAYQPGTRRRVAARIPAATLPTGTYAYDAVVTSYYTDSTTRAVTVPTIRIPIVNERNSPFGAGWTVAGVQRLYALADGSVNLTDGTGTVQNFVNPCTDLPCDFDSPTGDFTRLRLSESGDGSKYYTRTSPDGAVVAFDESGYESYAQDRLGNRTTFAYTNGPSGNRWISSVTDPAGKVTTIATAGTSAYGGPRLTITDPMGRITRLSLDTANDLVAIEDPAGALALQATYSSSHRLQQWTDRRGGVWTPGYDCAGHTNGVQQPAVTVGGVSVNPRPYLSDADAMSTGCSSSITGAANGLGGTITTPAPSVASDSVATRITDARGYTTAFQVDPFKLPVRITDPFGAVTRIERNSEGKAVRIQTPDGHVQKALWYGPRVYQVVDSTLGRTTDIAVDYWSRMTDSVVTTGAPTIRYFWGAGHLFLDSVRVASASGDSVTRFTYDTGGVYKGRVATVTNPRGDVTTYAYASSGLFNLASTTVGGFATTYGYDGYGRLQSVTDPLGQTTATYRDLLGRDSVAVGGVADTTRLGYDALYPTSLEDPIHQIYGWTPNALGWVTQWTDPRSQTATAQYDSAGNLRRVTSRRGQQVTTTYDALNRPLSDSSAVGTTTYAYAVDDRRAAAANAEATDTTFTDLAGRDTLHVTVLTIGGTSRRYEHRHSFDAQGRLTRRVTRGPVVSGAGAADTVRYVYNATTGLLDTLADVSGRRTPLAYDAGRAATQAVLPNGVTMTSTHAWTGGSGDLFYTRSGTRLPFGGRYSYDETGRVVRRLTPDTASFRSFVYDAGGRLIAAADSQPGTCTPYYTGNAIFQTYPGEEPAGQNCTGNSALGGGVTRGYAYDKVGNRAGTGSVVSAGNRVEQLVIDGQAYAFDYDDDGNVTRKRLVADSLRFGQRLTWNALGQLGQAVTTVDSVTTTVTYGYDAFGRRVRRTESGVNTYYLWDGSELVAELDGTSGAFTVEYVSYPGLDRPHSARLGGTAGQMVYVALNAEGNVVGLTDSAGTVVRDRRYGPFGEAEATSGTRDLSLQWKARERDAATRLYYVRARWYDPQTGRFVSEDPIGLEGGINPYAFAGNDPVNYSDPSGLDACNKIQLDHGGETIYTDEGKAECKMGSSYPTIVTVAPHVYTVSFGVSFAYLVGYNSNVGVAFSGEGARVFANGGGTMGLGASATAGAISSQVGTLTDYGPASSNGVMFSGAPTFNLATPFVGISNIRSQVMRDGYSRWQSVGWSVGAGPGAGVFANFVDWQYATPIVPWGSPGPQGYTCAKTGSRCGR